MPWCLLYNPCSRQCAWRLPRWEAMRLNSGAESLPLNLVDPIANLGSGGRYLEVLLLSLLRQKDVHTGRFPASELHDLGESGALGASDHLQYLRALAPGVRRNRLVVTGVPMARSPCSALGGSCPFLAKLFHPLVQQIVGEAADKHCL